MSYDVETDIYDGPLPLLVELTKAGLIDVFLIQLADLTHQYLARVKAAGVDLNQLAEPLPLLGGLLTLKARSLLPQAPVTDDEEVPISLEELQRRLKEYEQFKTVAQLLSELHALQHQHFTREPGEELDEVEVHTEHGDAVGFDVEITDLMSAFAQVLKRATAPVYEMQSEPWTVEMKVLELRTLLAARRQVRFFDLFSPAQSKLELVVTFLAMLELMRQRQARAVQEAHFGEIFVTVYERRIKPREVAAPAAPTQETHGTGPG